MRRLALKIDVDTWRGTREGVPRLVEALKRHGARATFLFDAKVFLSTKIECEQFGGGQVRRQ